MTPGKVFLICGKICSGKTFTSRRLIEENHAVWLSCDEVMADLFHHNEGAEHDRITRDVRRYLTKKAIEIALTGVCVVLDWGFWTRQSRREISALLAEKGIPTEWHYLAISDDAWERNIESRNLAVREGRTTDYLVDEGLRQKVLSLFEAPSPEEIDVWHTVHLEP